MRDKFDKEQVISAIQNSSMPDALAQTKLICSLLDRSNQQREQYGSQISRDDANAVIEAFVEKLV